jgi:hypothetical protein
MTNEPVVIDERAIAVAGVGARRAYMVLAFGCLIDVIVRGLFFNESAWDLMALVIVSSGVWNLCTRVKQVPALVISRRKILLIALLSAVVASGVAVAATLLFKSLGR